MVLRFRGWRVVRASHAAILACKHTARDQQCNFAISKSCIYKRRLCTLPAACITAPPHSMVSFAEWISIRHARAPMLGSKWCHGLCFVKPGVGAELLGQDGLAVVAPELCVGPVDHADEALQPRPGEAA